MSRARIHVCFLLASVNLGILSQTDYSVFLSLNLKLALINLAGEV